MVFQPPLVTACESTKACVYSFKSHFYLEVIAMTSHQVAVAGEALAASLFARAGCDVLIQYGPNQPDYDLVAMRGDLAIRVSVKGSRKSGWGLIQSFKKGRTYLAAADAWLAEHAGQRLDVVYCLICFKGKRLDEAPLAYLASPQEIAEHHKSGKHGTGTTILFLDHTPCRGVGKGHRHQIPSAWLFTQQRVEELFAVRRAADQVQAVTSPPLTIPDLVPLPLGNQPS